MTRTGERAMKTDILDLIDRALAENRQVKQQRLLSHVLWLCDNPTQLPITRAGWDHTTTATTDMDLNVSAMIADEMWKFARPELPVVCIRCCTDPVVFDRPFCERPDCRPYGWDGATPEVALPGFAAVADLPQPLHRGRIYAQPMVR